MKRTVGKQDFHNACAKFPSMNPLSINPELYVKCAISFFYLMGIHKVLVSANRTIGMKSNMFLYLIIRFPLEESTTTPSQLTWCARTTSWAMRWPGMPRYYKIWDRGEIKIVETFDFLELRLSLFLFKNLHHIFCR